jgi:hypothetical protein
MVEQDADNLAHEHESSFAGSVKKVLGVHFACCFFHGSQHDEIIDFFRDFGSLERDGHDGMSKNVSHHLYAMEIFCRIWGNNSERLCDQNFGVKLSQWASVLK